MNEKLKVVWLCHLSNKEMQDILHPLRRMGEFAPWIFSGIKAVENEQRFELHIVAPHYYVGYQQEFELRGIYYHFYNAFLPFIGHPGLPIFKGLNWYEYSDFRKSKKEVSNIVERIKPDVIHLYGGENPYYSAAILPLVNKYPTILTIQGFISQTKAKMKPNLVKRIEVENRVIKSVPVCFYRSKAQANVVLKINPTIKLMPNMFCSYELKYDNLPTEKKYDLVFFAAITKDKGIVDLLKSVQIIKQRKPDVSLCVIGGGNYGQFIEMSKDLGIADNVSWAGFLPTRKEVHFMVARSKISVLPTYNDMYPGTIIESMFLGIPLVTYDVDSNPEINQNYEAIRLVKVGDVVSLAETLYKLLMDDKQLKCLGKAGKKRAYEMFAPSDKVLCDEWMDGYRLTIELFNKTHALI